VAGKPEQMLGFCISSLSFHPFNGIHAQNQEVVLKSDIVMARDVELRPLLRVLCGRAKRVAYLANPASLDRIESGESEPVGFPWEDVFDYDPELFDRIERNPALWASARPLEP